MREPDIGTEVTGVVPETGDRVEGTYLGGYAWVPGQGPEHALLLVDGKRVSVAFTSLGQVED